VDRIDGLELKPGGALQAAKFVEPIAMALDAVNIA
jgi:hypothetical protein